MYYRCATRKYARTSSNRTNPFARDGETELGFEDSPTGWYTVNCNNIIFA